MKLWVDDERPCPIGWEQVFTSQAAITALTSGEVVEMSLDHDLGGKDTTRPVVIWMIENDVWPEAVWVHTANPVGMEWLTGMIDRYMPVE